MPVSESGQEIALDLWLVEQADACREGVDVGEGRAEDAPDGADGELQATGAVEGARQRPPLESE